MSKILSGPPAYIWQSTCENSGIEKSRYENYFAHKSIAYAYKIKEVIRFAEPIPLRDIGIGKPPQSFTYLEIEQFDFICARAKRSKEFSGESISLRA